MPKAKEELRQAIRDAIDLYYGGDPIAYAERIEMLRQTYGDDLVKEVVSEELAEIRRFFEIE